MTQQEINRAVSRATGESIGEISHRGFVPLTGIPFERDHEDLILDWDLVQFERNIAMFE